MLAELLDLDTILISVRKTNRLVIAYNSHRRLDIGAEIAAPVQEHAFDYLDVPTVGVGAMDVLIPYSVPLESAVLPRRKERRYHRLGQKVGGLSGPLTNQSNITRRVAK